MGITQHHPVGLPPTRFHEFSRDRSTCDQTISRMLRARRPVARVNSAMSTKCGGRAVSMSVSQARFVRSYETIIAVADICTRVCVLHGNNKTVKRFVIAKTMCIEVLQVLREAGRRNQNPGACSTEIFLRNVQVPATGDVRRQRPLRSAHMGT